MSYAEADLLSSENKSFVRDLFPSGMIYTSLLSPEAQSVIGKVGGQTRGVEKMLRRIGFRYAKRIDPFDGGPHFIANAEEVAPIRETVRATLAVGTPPANLPRAIVGRDLAEPPYFRAVAVPAVVGEGSVTTTAEAGDALGASAGDAVFALTVPRGERTGT
jgi:arginine N-succinyltransferase